VLSMTVPFTALHCIWLSLYGRSPRPPRPTLFPYTTLFRSARAAQLPPVGGRAVRIGRARLRRGRGRLPAHRHGARRRGRPPGDRSEEHTSELQSRVDLVCRLLLEKKKDHKVQQSASTNRTS